MRLTNRSARGGGNGRIRRALALAVGASAVALTLGACVTGPTASGGLESQWAQPASAAGAPPEALTRFEPSAEGVEIAPVEGAPGPMGKLLQRSVAAAFGRYNVPASFSPGGGRYLLSGRAGPNRDPAQASVVAIEWQIFDRRQGRETARFILPVAGDQFAWDYGDPRAIAQVGDGTSRQFVALIDGTRPVAVSHGPGESPGGGPVRAAPKAEDMTASAPPSASPSSARATAASPAPAKIGPTVFLARVGGAPGDGNAALAQAAQAALVVGGLGAASRREDARYIVAGSVNVAAPAGGRQPVRIVWEVSAPDGRPLGRAVQENAVPEGSLNGPWGPMASLVAGAAVAGITDVIRRSEETAAAARAGESPRALNVAPLSGRAAPSESAERRLKVPPPVPGGPAVLPPALAPDDASAGKGRRPG
jgi:hypothetical protein